MADPRDVEAARECRGDLAKWLGLDSWNYARVFENVEREVIVPLLAAAREQERESCEQIVREASEQLRLEGEPMEWRGGRRELRQEILRRIRERVQPAPASQEGPRP